MSRQQTHVLYTGHVQGVGFRATTQFLARSLQVVGFVRNLDDGRVELIAEGERTEVEQLLAGISERLGDHIRDENIDHCEPTGTYQSFEIRYS